jgi:hypothetical protein
VAAETFRETFQDVNGTIDGMLPIIDQWKQKYGEEIATELIRAYLTGVNDACRTMSTLGAGAQHAFYERLRGN